MQTKFTMTKLVILFSFLGCSFLMKAQEEDAEKKGKFCQDITNKKAIALYEKGTDKKKYQKPERLEFLKKSMELEPDFAEPYLAAGLEFVARFKLEEKPFTQTLPFFYKAIGLCPQIHSEPYYYIGFDYYERRMNDSATKYLENFISFKDGDEKKFSKDYSDELYNAKMMVKSAKKENALKKNVQFDPKVITGVSTPRDEYLPELLFCKAPAFKKSRPRV